MPKQKDLKRVVRTRMQKTGESYTAARLRVVKPEPDYAALAGKSDESVRKATGHSWAEWVAKLDAVGGTEKAHRDLTAHVSSLGTPSWWTQTVVVGYERIRGLRAVGQARGGTWQATKSRTFAVPVAKLFAAFSNARQRARWLPGVKLTVRGATKDRSMRIALEDGTVVLVGFMAKGESKSSVAVEHTRLAAKADADRVKAFWGERFDALSRVFA
jgi:hypothetical protein